VRRGERRTGTVEPFPLRPDVTRRRDAERKRPPVASGSVERGAYAALMDNMIASSERQVVARVTVAAATGLGVAADVVAGIADEAEFRGLKPAVVQLKVVNGRSVIERHPYLFANDLERDGRPNNDDADHRDDLDKLDKLILDLRSEAGQHALDQWLQDAADHADLLIVEGLPLDGSFDTALVARACDGLVIVAEPKKTTKACLRFAAERAHGAGCHVLGVCMASPQRSGSR